MEFYVAVVLPEFPLTAWARHAPAVRGTACAVLEGTAPQQSVMACSAEARRLGVAVGMNKAQAEATGPVTFLARRRDLEMAAAEGLRSILERYSPRVQTLPSCAPGEASLELLLDGSGIEALFGDRERFCARLYRELGDAGVEPWVGGAPNAQAALLLARGGGGGVAVVEEDGLRERLAPLPVSLLPCGEEVLGVLARWGIRTLRQVAELPEAALVSRLGEQGVRLQRMARGEAEHLLEPDVPEEELRETAALEQAVETLEALLWVVSPMLENLLRKAREHATVLRELTLEMRLERRGTEVMRIRPSVPTEDRELLLKLLHLELQAKPPVAGVMGVVLLASVAQPMRAQGGLFETQFPEPDRLDILLSRLRGLVGEGSVGSLGLLNSHDEDAFSVLPFAPQPTAEEGERDATLQRLALRSLRPPEPVEVQLWNQRPAKVLWMGREHAVVFAAGPWHTSGSWWSAELWSHDLWDVVTESPLNILRLRMDHAARAWFVEAVYD